MVILADSGSTLASPQTSKMKEPPQMLLKTQGGYLTNCHTPSEVAETKGNVQNPGM
jgi:hypothetical protein